MPTQTRIVLAGTSNRMVQADDGRELRVPDDWALLPPGDAALTRRVKATGPTWTVQEKKGRRTFSRGVWACEQRIAEIRSDLQAERSTEAYAKRRKSDADRRHKKQADYVEDFRAAVLAFLDFAPRHSGLAQQLADAVTLHATPVGSGTVARTQRIPIGRRAESAVIAWLRHQTTAYDHMTIPRVKGQRREIRRMLAAESRRLLGRYRDDGSGDARDPGETNRCPLRLALEKDNAVKDTGNRIRQNSGR